ncbi:terminase small subunit [Pseudomonas sp. NPDC086581]|uniref:terminase small subunit n=1 Tax=Pseudomonas sp. NPDC086581 TaxID=3364432 RepID=UPI0037F674FF
MTLMRKSEYADSRGWSRSYVSKLAREHRLVLAPDGKHVDAVATDALLKQTADPSKAGVTARHESNRVQNGVTDHLAPDAPPLPAAEPAPPGVHDFQKARAHREFYLGQLAEDEFRKQRGQLVEKDAVDAGAFTSARTTRDLVLGLPKQIAPELAALADPWEVERVLTESLRRTLTDAARMIAADGGAPIDTS